MCRDANRRCSYRRPDSSMSKGRRSRRDDAGTSSVVKAPSAGQQVATRSSTTWMEGAATSIYDSVVFLLLRIALVDLTFAEVRGRSCKGPPKPAHKVDADQAELLLKLQREDSDHTDTKVRQLLTLASSLVTVVLVFAR